MKISSSVPRNDNFFFYGPSGSGLLLLNGSMTQLHANREAVSILAWPEDLKKIKSLDDFLVRKIRSVLKVQSSEGAFVSAFISGRRRYTCRAFVLESSSKYRPNTESVFALLIERPFQLSLDTLRVAAKFQLTQRERETMEFLIQGYTSKEIALQMRISPNTVKAFIKTIMLKTGTSTRSAIVGKILSLIAASIAAS